MSIVDDKLKLIDDSSARFTRGLGRTNSAFYNNIISALSEILGGDKSSQLPINKRFIGNIETMVVKSLRSTNYKAKADAFLKDFDAVNEINKLMHKEVNNININKIINENRRQKVLLSNFTNDLKGIFGKSKRSELLVRLIAPISELIRKNALFGVTLKDATKDLRKKIIDGNLGLERWAGQIARDSMRKYDGSLQNEIRKKHKMEYFNYVGTISEGTRPLCFSMLSKNRPYWTIPQLKAELDEHIPNGVPSEVKVTYAPLGKKKTLKKGSGLIPGTTVDNFPELTGGYNCDDSYVPRKRPPRS